MAFRKGVAGFMIFVLIAASVVSIIIVGNWLVKALNELSILKHVKGIVDFYVNLDDKGTEFSFLDVKNDNYTFMEILGVIGSGAKIEGDLKTQLENLERSLEKNRNSDKKNYYLAVLNPEGKVVYEKKNGNPPVTLGTGGEDIALKWPLPPQNDVINSGFGWRKDPFTGKDTFHGALDIHGNTGDPVYSATDGEVIYAGEDNSGYGKHVIIKYISQKTNTPYQILYGHLNSISVKSGFNVKAGEEIGKVGSTGRSEAPHLHFEVIKDENNDGAYTSKIESVNLCLYLTNSRGTGIVDTKQCMKNCPVYENPNDCGADITVVKNRFDLPIPGGKKGGVELVLW
jgi:murein DD-endopeptidase MepM/ murein hydrolase activator NlpD